MTKVVCHTLLALLLAGGLAYAAEAPNPPDSPPANAPLPQQAAPAPQPPLDPALDKLLDNLEQHSIALKTFQADMIYSQEQLDLDVVTVQTGRLYYQADDQRVFFRIHFDDFLQQDLDDDKTLQPVKTNEDIAFDGLWLTRRNERTKFLQKWEIAKTARKPEDFRLGKGPFPLPFALRKADILAEFHPELVKPCPSDPNNTHHLLLKPKPKSTFAEEYLALELWFSRDLFLPQQLRMLQPDNELTLVQWSKLKIDKKIPEKDFQLQAPGPDWSVETVPLSDETSATEPPA